MIVEPHERRRDVNLRRDDPEPAVTTWRGRVSQLQIEGLLFWFPAFIFSTTVHEAAHAWAALRGGDATAYRGGQLTLSPLPHIRREPIGMLVLPLLTSVTNGWASAPFDPAWAARRPRRAALMAAAGPAANLAIAAVALAAIKAGMATGWFEIPPGPAPWSALVVPAGQHAELILVAVATRALSVLLSLNALLAVFNLIPLPPLDGSAVVDILLPPRYAGVMRRLGPIGSLLGLVVAWKVFPALVGPILGVIERLLGR
jgi:Zn-dependent protease